MGIVVGWVVVVVVDWVVVVVVGFVVVVGCVVVVVVDTLFLDISRYPRKKGASRTWW